MENGILIQLIGFIGFLFIVASVQKNKRSFTLFLQLISALFFTLHFALLGAWTGAVMNILAALRAYIFNLRGKRRFFNHPIILYLFIDLFWIGGLVTWVGYLSILPALSLTLESFALWSKKTKYLRLILLSATIPWMIYHFSVSSYAGIATESFMIISIITAIVRFDILKR